MQPESIKRSLFFGVVMLAIWACSHRPLSRSQSSVSISDLRYIDEYVFPENEKLEGQLIGGFSGIDYADGKWIIISDAQEPPIRYYRAIIDYDLQGFKKMEILSQVEILDSTQRAFAPKAVDPEAIRFSSSAKNIVWTSEGNINKGISPSISVMALSGEFLNSFKLPKLFLADSINTSSGPRHNGSFEGLSMNKKGYWAAMEHPLIQDGKLPVFGKDLSSPVRFVFFNKKTGRASHQFAYDLGPVVRNGSFTVNGISEILEYDRNKFLVIERSFAQGHKDGGNNILIYKANATRATDVSGMDSLNGSNIRMAEKSLLFDFESIRQHLSSLKGGTPKVDNIEGICFGPKFINGHYSLLVIADNNFNSFGSQLNQLILFEVIP